MKPDRQKTKVFFLIETEIENNEPTENVWAFFPELIENEGKDLYLCYAHIGQHSTASKEYAKLCKRANESQYKDLKKELESIGYNLLITENF